MELSNTYSFSVWFQTPQIQWENGVWHKSKLIYCVEISEMKIVVTRQLVYSDVGVASSRSFKDVRRRSSRCWWRQNAQKYRLRWLLTAECQTMNLFWARNFYSDHSMHFAKYLKDIDCDVCQTVQLFWARNVYIILLTRSMHFAKSSVVCNSEIKM